MVIGWLVALCVAAPAIAGTRFQARQMTRNDIPAGKGQCDIRLQVDGEVEVTVRGDRVDVRTVSGKDARDDGSECSLPLPKIEIGGFHFQVMERRDEIRLVDEPGPRNGFSAVVHIRDNGAGEGRYHFRLSWSTKNYDLDRPAAGAGFSWNNTVSFKGAGSGKAVVNGKDETTLQQVTVEIDRSGKLAIWFHPDRGRPLSFTGQLLATEGGKLKVDVMSEDRRLRGPMWIAVDRKQQVESVSLNATDGNDRLVLSWARK